MMTNQCWRCLHYRGDLSCDAFPTRIPEAILTGKHDHTKPLGEETSLFKLIPDSENLLQLKK